MTESQFWTEVRRRRNRIFIWYITWPLNFAIAFALVKLFGVEPETAGFVVHVAWFGVLIWALFHLRKLACPKCGKPAFEQPHFLMRNAKCQACGYAHEPKDPSA